MLQELGLSQRRACRLAYTPRSTARYHSIKEPETALRDRIKALADEHRRFGLPRIHALLRREGFRVNHKKTHRIYCEERLQVRKRKRKRRTAIARRPMLLQLLPTAVGRKRCSAPTLTRFLMYLASALALPKHLSDDFVSDSYD